MTKIKSAITFIIANALSNFYIKYDNNIYSFYIILQRSLITKELSFLFLNPQNPGDANINPKASTSSLKSSVVKIF